MAQRPDALENTPSPRELGQAAAAHIGPTEWQLDAPTDAPPAPVALPTETPDSPAPGPGSLPVAPSRPMPPSTDPPPSPDHLVEAMLFVGGSPLTLAVACAAVRGLTAERFEAAVDELNKRYRRQSRPYAVYPRDGGYVLALLPEHRGLRERLFGGPREARLSQPALDVLAVVAYRQPVGKAEVDAVRGTDSGGVLRQLVRLGLVSVQHRAEAGTREVRYGTTQRFLQVFGLTSLDELPQLGGTHPV